MTIQSCPSLLKYRWHNTNSPPTELTIVRMPFYKPQQKPLRERGKKPSTHLPCFQIILSKMPKAGLSLAGKKFLRQTVLFFPSASTSTKDADNQECDNTALDHIGPGGRRKELQPIVPINHNSPFCTCLKVPWKWEIIPAESCKKREKLTADNSTFWDC